MRNHVTSRGNISVHNAIKIYVQVSIDVKMRERQRETQCEIKH